MNFSIWWIAGAFVVTFGWPAFGLIAVWLSYLAFRKGASPGAARPFARWLSVVFAIAALLSLSACLDWVLNNPDGPFYARYHQMRWLDKAETIEGIRVPAKAFVKFAYGKLVQATVNDGVRLGPLETLASTLTNWSGRPLWGDEYAAGERGGLRVSVAGRDFLMASGCQFHDLHKADGTPYVQLLADQPEACRKVLEGLE